jgi:cytochrome c556
MTVRLRAGAVAAALLTAVVAISQSSAQIKKGKTRPMTTKQLMAGLVGPDFHGIEAALKESGPADDKAWTNAATQAALLNEASYVMMADGRCPDATWAEACKTLQECSTVLLAKIEAKDVEGARGALSAMTKSCATCHGAFKK